jgi:hypothetical protein
LKESCARVAYVRCVVFLADFNQNWNRPINFNDTPRDSILPFIIKLEVVLCSGYIRELPGSTLAPDSDADTNRFITHS